MHQRIIRRIVRVNHADEHGAVAIYSKQLARARHSFPDLLPWLQETLGHEIEHQQKFYNAMEPRGAKPCRLMFIWSLGGTLLGMLSGLFGRNGVFVCTIAVERTVHHHLVEQINFLKKVDPELAAIIDEILQQEDEHLESALAKVSTTSVLHRVLEPVVAFATELLILISTRGDSFFLRRVTRQSTFGD